jgi:Fuc2NAc and GlcNAc transferase
LWNWPPAKVFLGDAGSGFLGLTLGALWIHSSRATPELLWSWAILLGVFVVDATVTLLRRVYRGAKSYEAHRDHAYQHAALQHGAHVWVTIAIGALNLFWLLPLAWLVAEARLDGLVGLLIAYTPLVWLGIRYEAGITHRREVVD